MDIIEKLVSTINLFLSITLSNTLSDTYFWTRTKEAKQRKVQSSVKELGLMIWVSLNVPGQSILHLLLSLKSPWLFFFYTVYIACTLNTGVTSLLYWPQFFMSLMSLISIYSFVCQVVFIWSSSLSVITMHCFNFFI